MTVWVEDAQWPRGKFICGHLLADSLEELHALADVLQIKRQYFIEYAVVPHYSIPEHKLELAIAAGAVKLDREQRQAILLKARSGCATEQPRVPGGQPGRKAQLMPCRMERQKSLF
ncbi:DUF4031 domain-containing protein [Xanthomonas sacchari]|uniref:DUF4031 domain-containing protein n=1 Tax=Xanthomonas sacchari TaxID=56458 RepID=UPI00225E28F8|nr:DUF4031 domain-containing protein [Xanthomonas sacchari]